MQMPQLLPPLFFLLSFFYISGVTLPFTVLEIYINRCETLHILRQWHEKCVQSKLKLMHIQSQNDGVT